MKPVPSLEYEQRLWHNNPDTKPVVVGLDEVGRGALAGPVVVGAVAFSPQSMPIAGVADSKLLSRAQRQNLLPQIKTQSLRYGLGESTVEEINTLGLATALLLAMQRALQPFNRIDHLLLDGKPLTATSQYLAHPTTWIIKGDQLCYTIAAASIIAKEYRDAHMLHLAKKHPLYHWNTNVGYGSSAHRAALQLHGPCSHHRTLFIQKCLKLDSRT